MTMKTNKEKLKNDLRQAIKAYTKALCQQWEWDSYYGYWAADDCTGVYCYGEDYYISLSDLVYIVDNSIELNTFSEWYDYTVFCSEYGLNTPNLRSWVMGCPRMSKEEQDKLAAMRKELNELISDFKEKY